MLGDLETRVLADELHAVRIERPVFICGLARSGSTVLLEALHAHPHFTAHHYSDYPPLWTPYWWNRLRARLPLPRARAQERAHGDRIAVTPDSPEAFEEVFWMHFFPGRHDADVDQVLGEHTSHPAFEAFYRAHLRKLLAVRAAPRYLAKANYSIARIGYLARLFPDARFIVPLRDPLDHVASLLRQDRLFSDAAQADPAIARHLARVGHFEFGPHKRVQHLGDSACAAAIAARFAQGDAVGAYAMQWAAVYGFVAGQMRSDAQLAAACLVVRYEALCRDPQRVLRGVFEHAGAYDDDGRRIVADVATRLRAPDYYQPDISAADRARIADITAAVAGRLGLPDPG